MSSSDGKGRHLSRLARSGFGARAAGQAPGVDRLLRQIQSRDEGAHRRADHHRGGFSRAAGFAVSLTGAGTQTTGVVVCSQPRALDVAARGGVRLESVPDFIMDEVLARLAAVLE